MPDPLLTTRLVIEAQAAETVDSQIGPVDVQHGRVARIVESDVSLARACWAGGGRPDSELAAP